MRHSTYRAGGKVVLGLAAALSLAAVGSASAQEGGRKLSTTLSGAAERPGPGDPDGSGSFSGRVNIGKSQLCYELTVKAIAPAMAAHMHEGPPSAAGPIRINLKAATTGASSGCVAIDAALAKDLVQSPEDYYVNVHNREFPAGAVRGQLRK